MVGAHRVRLDVSAEQNLDVGEKASGGPRAHPTGKVAVAIERPGQKRRCRGLRSIVVGAVFWKVGETREVFFLQPSLLERGGKHAAAKPIENDMIDVRVVDRLCGE